MKKRKKISLILTACTAFVLAAEGSALADDTETISKNVYIGGVNVSGMTEEQATKAVEEKLGKGTRRMPRRREPKKDVLSCEKPGGGAQDL